MSAFSWKIVSIGSAIGVSIFVAFKKPERTYADANKPLHIEFQEKTGGVGLDFTDKGNTQYGISKYGFPQRSAEANHFKNHSLCYNYEKKIPHWVLELLVKHNLKGVKAERGKAGGFKEDPNQPQLFSASMHDYKKSGWSRGHMAASGNHNHDQEAMNDTYYLSNIVPQDIKNNSGFWNRLETFTRQLLSKYDKVYVLSGPLFLSKWEGNKRVIKYEVIGRNEVAVPTHLFKVLLAENSRRSVMAAFVVPNEEISNNKKLDEFEVTLDFLESKSGFVMFPNLDRRRVGKLCREDGCDLPQDFELYSITKRIRQSRDLQSLHEAYQQLEEKNLKPDQILMDAYHAKKSQLGSTDSSLLSSGSRRLVGSGSDESSVNGGGKSGNGGVGGNEGDQDDVKTRVAAAGG